jgi:Tol biopolymer transport system component
VTGYEELGPLHPIAGQGGAVRARRPSDGAEVVLKRLSGAGSEAWLGQVARRAEWLARMGHPALPRIFEVMAEESGLVIVMEYAAGGSLADRLAGGGMLRPGVVAELFSTLGEGLEVAHRAGILHLDLKPSNILFRANGDAFLSDFGHDRLLETTGQPTPGAAEYLDPAVAEGTPPDAQTDVYALAALSYQALTGSPPFSGESVVEVAEALRGDRLRPVADVVSGLPALLAGAVERALARPREHRYPSAGAFAEALLPGQGTVLPALPASDVLPPMPPPEAVAVPWMPAPEEPPPARAGRGRALGRWPVGAAVLAAVILVAALVAVPTLLRVVGLRGTPATHLLVGPAPSSPEPSPTLASLPVVEVPTSTPPGPSPSPSPHPTPTAPKPGLVPAPRRPIPATTAAPAFVPSRGPIPAPPLPPKGQRIAFTGTKDGRPSIYVTDPTGSVVIRLTNSPVGEDSQPAWSPDGTRIAFTSTRDGSRQIYLMNADGSNQHRLTAGTANNYDPAWDPTSATIAYVSDQTGTAEVYAIGALGGQGQYAGPAPVQNYAHSTFAQPAFSPDGQTLAATTLLGGTMIVTWKVSGALIAGLNSPPIPHVENPAWSPSGSKIVYGSSDAKVQVWVMAPDGSGKLALTGGPSNNAEPRFSPTGDRIVFVTDRVGLRQVWAMSADGTHQALVVNVPGETYDPSWG